MIFVIGLQIVIDYNIVKLLLNADYSVWTISSMELLAVGLDAIIGEQIFVGRCYWRIAWGWHNQFWSSLRNVKEEEKSSLVWAHPDQAVAAE